MKVKGKKERKEERIKFRSKEKRGKELGQVEKKDGFKFVMLRDNFSGKANRKSY